MVERLMKVWRPSFWKRLVSSMEKASSVETPLHSEAFCWRLCIVKNGTVFWIKRRWNVRDLFIGIVVFAWIAREKEFDTVGADSVLLCFEKWGNSVDAIYTFLTHLFLFLLTRIPLVARSIFYIFVWTIN